MTIKSVSEINEYVRTSVNPLATPDQLFELYSVPSFDSDYPEIVSGAEIGSAKVTVEEGDVLICKINPRINRVWVVRHNTDYPLLASSEWIVVRSKNMNPHYLKWYFSSSSFRTLLTSQVTGIGGSLTRAQPKQVAKYPVPVPSRAEQDYIAGVLERIDELLLKQHQQTEKLDELVKSRFIELFGDPLSNSKGWPCIVITDACRAIFGGGTPSKSHPEYFTGTVPWVSPKDMKSSVISDSIDHITEEAIAHSTTNLVPAHSVLMVIRSGILKHTLPVATNSVPVTINQDMKAFVPNGVVTTAFLMHFFKAIEPDVLAGVRGVTADNIDFKAFQKRTIIVPPMELQEQFAAFVAQTDKSKLAVQQGLKELEILKKSLMQQYFG
jgi:hypothetical protein